MLSSFAIDPNRYRTAVPVPVENVLFYENLCPFKEVLEQDYVFSLGLHVEWEVVVFNKEEFWDKKSLLQIIMLKVYEKTKHHFSCTHKK